MAPAPSARASTSSSAASSAGHARSVRTCAPRPSKAPAPTAAARVSSCGPSGERSRAARSGSPAGRASDHPVGRRGPQVLQPARDRTGLLLRGPRPARRRRAGAVGRRRGRGAHDVAGGREQRGVQRPRRAGVGAGRDEGTEPLPDGARQPRRGGVAAGDQGQQQRQGGGGDRRGRGDEERADDADLPVVAGHLDGGEVRPDPGAEVGRGQGQRRPPPPLAGSEPPGPDDDVLGARRGAGDGRAVGGAGPAVEGGAGHRGRALRDEAGGEAGPGAAPRGSPPAPAPRRSSAAGPARSRPKG